MYFQPATWHQRHYNSLQVTRGNALVQVQSDRGMLWADDSHVTACGTFGCAA